LHFYTWFIILHIVFIFQSKKIFKSSEANANETQHLHELAESKSIESVALEREIDGMLNWFTLSKVNNIYYYYIIMMISNDYLK